MAAWRAWQVMARAVPPRVGGGAAIVGLVVGLGGVVAAAVVTPGFSWTQLALSDLGVMAYAWLFNGSLVVGGVALVVFALALDADGTARRAGRALLVAGGVALVLVGVFPTDVEPHHLLASLGFFALTAVGILARGVADLRTPPADRRLDPGVVGVAAGAVATLLGGILIGMIFDPGGPGIAVPEILHVTAVSAWVVFEAVGMLRDGADPTSG